MLIKEEALSVNSDQLNDIISSYGHTDLNIQFFSVCVPTSHVQITLHLKLYCKANLNNHSIIYWVT